MEENNSSRGALYLLLIVIVIFIAGRLFGTDLFDNNWSFAHWQSLSGWYIVLWFAISAIAVLLLTSLTEKIALLFNSPLKVLIASAVLFALFIVFQFDSFLYGGGNTRIAQIAQVERVIYRWFEYGSIWAVSWLDGLFDLFNIQYNAAGVYAWKVFAFACTALTILGSLQLVRELTANKTRRFYLFVILLFGPQTVLYFGFIGVEPAVVAISTWFALLAMRLSNRFTTTRLLALWGIVFLGVFVHFTLLYILPAAVYVTAKASFKRRQSHLIALVIALASYVGLLFSAYYVADHNLEFSKYLLFLSGKNPHSDYGLFSLRHISDMLQILFLAFPQAVIAAYLVATQSRKVMDKNSSLLLPLLMALSGITVVLILDPINSIVLGYPRFTAYLLPFSFLLVYVLNESWPEGKKEPTPLLLLACLAATCLVFPLSYLPGYIRIARADPYVTSYLEKHDSFYLSGCLSFRDAYFYRKELDQANAWEQKLPLKSPDYLNIRGCGELALAGEDAEALRTLHKMIAQNPYWSEPRALVASIQMKLGRYKLAKPQIDTCLMLDPYKKDHLVNLYRYYRDVQSYPQALDGIKRTLQVYPQDDDIKTDLMIVYYRSGAFQTADSLADALLTADTTLPYPYLIKGLIAERQKNPQTAISLYEKFIALAPDEPDTPAIKEQLNKLKQNIKGE